MEYDPGRGKRRQNVHTKQWKYVKEYDKIELKKGITVPRSEPSRGMANGSRRGALTHVSEDEEKQIRQWADQLVIPQSVLRFNTGSFTGFVDVRNVINIRGDVFPSQYAQNPDSILNARCALAHEYYGHMKHHPSKFPIGDWRDEFRASYRAAIDTPNLTSQERGMLMLDAFDRTKEAGIPVKLNAIARRYIYGIE